MTVTGHCSRRCRVNWRKSTTAQWRAVQKETGMAIW